MHIHNLENEHARLEVIICSFNITNLSQPSQFQKWQYPLWLVDSRFKILFYTAQLCHVVLLQLEYFRFLCALLYSAARTPPVKKRVISELPFFNNRIQQPCLLNQNFGKGSINPIVHIDEKYVSQYLNCSDVKISASYTIALVFIKRFS